MVLPLGGVGMTGENPVAERAIVATLVRARNVKCVEAKARVAFTRRQLRMRHTSTRRVQRTPAVRTKALKSALLACITTRVREECRQIGRHVAQETPTLLWCLSRVDAHLCRRGLTHHSHTARPDPLEISGHGDVARALQLQRSGADVVHRIDADAEQNDTGVA